MHTNCVAVCTRLTITVSEILVELVIPDASCKRQLSFFGRIRISVGTCKCGSEQLRASIYAACRVSTVIRDIAGGRRF